MILKGKRILVTGGSSGIGKAAAIEIAKQGAEVIIQARNLEKLKTAAKEIAATGAKVHYYSTDLTTSEAVEASANQIIEEVGLPDVIINSAGAGEWLSLEEAATPEYFSETMASPYLVTAYTIKVFYDKMKARGNGHFIIINSAACYFTFPAAIGYLAARYAMLGYSKALQADLHGTDFKVSMVALGKVDSPYFKNNPKSEARIPGIVGILVPTLTEEESGKIIAKTVKSQKETVIAPFMLRMLVFFNRFFPGIFDWIMRLTGGAKN